MFIFTSCSVISRPRERYYYEPRPIYHTLQPGERIEDVAQKYHTTSSALALLNGFEEGVDIRSGDKIFIAFKYYQTTHKPSAYEGKDEVPAFSTTTRASLRSVPVRAYKNKLFWPLSTQGKLSSVYGPRDDVFDGRASFHDGLDLSAPVGTPALAAHDGKVIYANNGIGGYGNLLVLKDNRGFLTIYAHNSELLVKKGEYVKKGQMIAEVGATGKASGPHLHFELRFPYKNAKNRQTYRAVDPLPYLISIR